MLIHLIIGNKLFDRTSLLKGFFFLILLNIEILPNNSQFYIYWELVFQ